MNLAEGIPTLQTEQRVKTPEETQVEQAIAKTLGTDSAKAGGPLTSRRETGTIKAQTLQEGRKMDNRQPSGQKQELMAQEKWIMVEFNGTGRRFLYCIPG